MAKIEGLIVSIGLFYAQKTAESIMITITVRKLQALKRNITTSYQNNLISKKFSLFSPNDDAMTIPPFEGTPKRML